MSSCPLYDSTDRTRYFDVTLLDDSGLVQEYSTIKWEKDSLGIHKDTASVQKQFYDGSGRFILEKIFRNGKITDSIRFTWNTDNYCTRRSYSIGDSSVYTGTSRQKKNVWHNRNYKNGIWQSTYIEKYRRQKTILIYKRRKKEHYRKRIIYLNAGGDAERVVTRWRHKVIVGYTYENDENGFIKKTIPHKAKRSERKYNYEYDSRGLITKRVEEPYNNKDIPDVRIYEYDPR
jgi:hypothetical protein